MDFTEILKLLSGPIIGAVIGYFTNMIAVKMLFYPQKEIRLFGRRLPFTPGVIPKGRARLAASVGTVIEKHLLTRDDITRHLLSEQAEKKVADTVMEKLSGNIKDEILALTDMDSETYEQRKAEIVKTVSVQIVNAIQSSGATDTIVTAFSEAHKEKVNYTPLKLIVNDITLNAVIPPTKDMLDTMIDERGTEYIAPVVDKKLNESDSQSGLDLLAQFNLDEHTVRKAVIDAYRKIVIQSVDGILQSVNISSLVEEKINDMSIEEMEKLVQDVMKKELNAIVNLGALIGFILGIINVLIK